MSPIHDEKAEKSGGAFLPNFHESLFLALNYTLGTNFVPNVLKKVLSLTRLMRYRPIKIIFLMTLQSSLASKVTVIAGILVCIMVGLPIDLPYAP